MTLFSAAFSAETLLWLTFRPKMRHKDFCRQQVRHNVPEPSSMARGFPKKPSAPARFRRLRVELAKRARALSTSTVSASGTTPTPDGCLLP